MISKHASIERSRLNLWQWLLVLLVCCTPTTGFSFQDDVTLLRTFRIPGNQVDKSKLDEMVAPAVQHNLFGGISAMEYLGRDDLFLALPDRGPQDGAVDWDCRVHLLHIPLDGPSNPKISQTAMLRDGDRQFSGFYSRFKPTKNKTTRLDPEGIRLAGPEAFFLSDEYGPHVLKFSLSGALQDRLAVPDRYQVAVPCKTKKEENAKNQTGRQGNRGMEGLAISADQKTLFGLMQSPLLQDSERDAKGKPQGLNCRLIAMQVESGEAKEFLYRLDSNKNKLNEILHLRDQQFLVIERDGKSGSQSRYKKIIKIDLAGASEVQAIDKLPANEIPTGIQPVAKQVFIDLLDNRFKLSGDEMPEKIESLTFGPDLPDGRRTLLVASDNDFKTEQPTLIYCFAIGKTDSGESTRSAAN